MTNLFVNISVHPIAGWTDKQKQAAKDLFPAGSKVKFVDLGFPNIDPKKSTEKVFVDYSSRYIDKYIEAEEANTPVEFIKIHLMGEMTFCAAFLYKICKLRVINKNDIKIYAATTERIVEEKDGIKTSRFEFVRFRRLV